MHVIAMKHSKPSLPRQKRLIHGICLLYCIYKWLYKLWRGDWSKNKLLLTRPNMILRTVMYKGGYGACNPSHSKTYSWVLACLVSSSRLWPYLWGLPVAATAAGTLCCCLNVRDVGGPVTLKFFLTPSRLIPCSDQLTICIWIHLS